MSLLDKIPRSSPHRSRRSAFFKDRGGAPVSTVSAPGGGRDEKLGSAPGGAACDHGRRSRPPPFRHLEYAFAIYPTAKPNGGYYNGTMTVDILGAAPDGGMLVRASDWWYYTLRPRQAVECEVYESGDVHCDSVPPYPSDSDLVLFPLLAQNFFSRGSPASTSSWRQKFALSFAKGLYVTAVSMDLSATPQNGGRVLIVTSKGVFQQLDRRDRKALEEGRFVYDRVASLPVVVHEVRSPTPTGSTYSQTAVDLQLTKDSALQPGPGADTLIRDAGSSR